jgi:hypothetical protein
MKFDAIKAAMMKKQPQLKKYMSNTPLNQKHLAVLNEMGNANYDFPPSSIDIAHRCFEWLIQDRNMQQQRNEQQQKLQTKPPQIGLSNQLPSMQQASPVPQASPQMAPIQQATIVVQPGMVATSSQPQQGQ